MKLELKKKILLVEDDEASAILAERILQDDFSVTIVTNGYIALKAVEMIRFDAVLMDINLGDHHMDGLKTMREIKLVKNNRRLKIFAITAFSDARNWYINEGFDDLITKPLNKEKVMSIIKSKMDTYVTGKSLLSKVPATEPEFPSRQ